MNLKTKNSILFLLKKGGLITSADLIGRGTSFDIFIRHKYLKINIFKGFYWKISYYDKNNIEQEIDKVNKWLIIKQIEDGTLDLQKESDTWNRRLSS